MFQFPEGAVLYMGTTFASAKTVTAISNADPAVASATAHGYTNADELLLVNGWGEATDSIYLASGVTTDSVALLGLDADSTAAFPAANSAGTLQKVSTWVEIPQVEGITPSGGDARYTSIELLSRQNGLSVPVGFNPSTLTLTLHHDPALTGWKTMLQLSRARSPLALRIVYPDGAKAYAYGRLAANPTPAIAKGATNKVTAAFSMLGQFTAFNA